MSVWFDVDFLFIEVVFGDMVVVYDIFVEFVGGL